ncbi:MAG: PilZ domain-containing protein [Defluviitaleaceae bacterium]|nr:PilZ domain-containing protein [Defluviitaleaceae bacterium]
MYIHQVPRGTTFTFTFDDGLEIDGIFDGNIDHLMYNIVCPEISQSIEKFIDKEPEVIFILSDMSYSFKSTILKISDNKDAINDSIEFKCISPIKDEALRKNFRIKIDLRVRIHEYVDDFKKLYTNGWICDSLSDDISKRGIRLFSDYNLDAPVDTPFTLEFTLHTGTIYLIPATLKRSGPNTVTRSYHYDYGFVFDFKDMEEKQEKLILEILEYKIRNRL